MAHAHDRAAFRRARGTIFGIALVAYVLSFFHRTAPAALAGELVRAFAIDATTLGTLAATYFYVYTALQIPVGVLADTMGPRKLLIAGSLVAGVGSLAFALAPTWELAAAGRTLVGIGVATAFIAVLKVTAVWFPPQRFATMNGVTLFAGNVGAVVAGAPLAWLVTVTSWRDVFVGLGVVSLALAVATWRRVRDRPQELGFAAVTALPPATAHRTSWRHALGVVLRNPGTWPGFFVNVGVAGSYLAFAGLWAVPFLVDVHHLSPIDAATHASLLLLGVAFGALAIGWLSDRLGSRVGLMRACTLLYALSWLPWLAHVAWPAWAMLAWCFVMGLLIPGFTLSWTLAKEANRAEHSGMATAVANAGIFLGTGLLQPAVGAVLDRGRAAGNVAQAWDHALWVMAGAAAFGAAAAWLARGKRGA
ncbi:MAG: MFS transporter [Burkholderiales bacterium]|nr:MFS transporter [Burkholderiales bacterium]